jgi:hypothetical protein
MVEVAEAVGAAADCATDLDIMSKVSKHARKVNDVQRVVLELRPDDIEPDLHVGSACQALARLVMPGLLNFASVYFYIVMACRSSSVIQTLWLATPGVANHT